MSGAIPEVLMDDSEISETLEHKVDPLDLMDPDDWAGIPTVVERFKVAGAP